MEYPVHTEGKWLLISLLFHFSLFAVISLAVPETVPLSSVRAEEIITLKVDLSGHKGKKASWKKIPGAEVSEKADPSAQEMSEASEKDIPVITETFEKGVFSGEVSDDDALTGPGDARFSGSAVSPGGDSGFIRAKILIPLNPEYPRYAVSRGFEGEVLLDADIDPSGTPLNVDIYKSSGHKVLDKAALDSVTAARFTPARYMGKDIPDRLRIAVNFNLKDYR